MVDKGKFAVLMQNPRLIIRQCIDKCSVNKKTLNKLPSNKFFTERNGKMKWFTELSIALHIS